MPSQQGGQQQQQVPTMGSTRWCPTPEQLMVLEEMYRGGMRTPTASQIQQITAHLADYGRIEGKNVFYWFQNHKARDRQKLRRRLCMSHHRHLLTCSAQYYAATATHHHHGHGFPATMPVAPAYGCGGGGVFDQPAGAAGVQLLAPTSPSPAAAAAYGYYYPAATTFAAAPTVRCAGDGGTTPPSPNQLFNYHQDGGGVALAPAEALGRPEHSLGKLADNFGVSTTLDDGVEIGPPGFEGSLPSPLTTALCRPLKTLDLFPGGLKEEQQHDVA